MELLIVGDHGQNGFAAQPVQEIKIDELLTSFSQATIGQGWQDDNEICICPNMRATSIYLRHRNEGLGRKVVETLLACSNIDQVIYKLDDHQWRVETADRGTLSFKYGGDTDSPKELDRYVNHWVIEGDLACIDAKRDDQGIIAYGVYPNALERIASAFVANSAPIWVTARPGAEFSINGAKVHEGGSHGALFQDDSEAALITTAGLRLDKLKSSSHPRIVDIVSLVTDTLSISSHSPLQRSEGYSVC